MDYIIMLILGTPNDLDAILDAWREIDVHNITFVESTCSQEGVCGPRPHIPIRFAFENLRASTEQCSCTLFAIAPNEATVQSCIAAVEAVIGDLNQAPGSVVVAWPTTISKGVPGASDGEGQA